MTQHKALSYLVAYYSCNYDSDFKAGLTRWATGALSNKLSKTTFYLAVICKPIIQNPLPANRGENLPMHSTIYIYIYMEITTHMHQFRQTIAVHHAEDAFPLGLTDTIIYKERSEITLETLSNQYSMPIPFPHRINLCWSACHCWWRTLESLT